MKDRNKSSSSFTDTQLELVKDEQKKVDAYKNRIIWSDDETRAIQPEIVYYEPHIYAIAGFDTAYLW